MYVPSHFSETQPEAMHDLIHAYPLATLVTMGVNGLEANHIPLGLEVSASGLATLSGHMARANPAWNEAGEIHGALAIFQGPASYISPNWYPTKQEHGKVVPTWNYVAVHAHGTLKFHTDPAWIRAQLERLTHQMESAQPHPWAVSDAPPDFTAKLIEHVVGIELVVERLVGKWKVSQNQPAMNQAGVIQGLESTGGMADLAMARIVGERSSL
jgi:transcriptional regulator